MTDYSDMPGYRALGARTGADLPKTPLSFLFLIHRRFFPVRIWAIIGSAVMSMALMGLEPTAFKYLTEALTEAMTGQAPGSFTGPVLWGFIAVAGLWFGSSIFNRTHELAEIGVMPQLRAFVQSILYAYAIEHSPRYFQENFAGKLAQRIKQAGQAAVQVTGILCHDCVRIVVILIIGLITLGAAHGVMAGVLAVWVIVFLGIAALMSKRCIGLSKEMSDQQSSVTGRLVDSIGNAELVRAFVRRDFERGHLSAFLDSERRASRRLRWFLLFMHFYQYTGVWVFQVGLIAFTVAEALAGRLTIGDFVMVFSLSNIIAWNVWQLSTRMLELFEQTGVLREALELVTLPHEIADTAEARPLKVETGAIALKNLGFVHANGNPVFAGLNLDIAGGEKVALVGPSGAGKSTLVKLIRRQFVWQSGRIEIDGQDIAAATLDSLNSAIAEVPQDPSLFHRPIAENIAYARPEAGFEDIVAAAKKAHCHDFIMARPDGYDAIVGEHGVKLSGGERQRIAIARAFLKDSPILILDEATSALDSETEQQIQAALWQLFEGRTVIAIAHRLSTITGMDRILYMERGEILEDGPHDRLIAADGAYAKLWNRQVGGFLPEVKAAE